MAIESSEAALRTLAKRLLAGGFVRPSFEEAAALRERRSPTGLPFPGLSVAIPHAEPEHVIAPAIAVASLVTPVRFRQMGSPATELQVSLVVMPALTAKEQAGMQLSGLIQLLQDETLRQELVQAPNGAAMSEMLTRKLHR